MTIDYLPAADRSPVPWRNGGGITREVAADRSGDRFQWRISIAEVDGDGPFSAFEGYHRVITLLRGAGMELTVDGVAHRIDSVYAPFAFPGAARTDCTLLNGPVTDLNVMVTDAWQSPHVEILRPERTVQIGATGTVAVVCLDGTVALGAHTLGALDAAILRDEPHASLTPEPAAVVMRVALGG